MYHEGGTNTRVYIYIYDDIPRVCIYGESALLDLTPCSTDVCMCVCVRAVRISLKVYMQKLGMGQHTTL